MPQVACGGSNTPIGGSAGVVVEVRQGSSKLKPSELDWPPFASVASVGEAGEAVKACLQEVVLTTAPTTSTHTHWGQQPDTQSPCPGSRSV